jgi:hypothetical protein
MTTLSNLKLIGILILIGILNLLRFKVENLISEERLHLLNQYINSDISTYREC